LPCLITPSCLLCTLSLTLLITLAWSWSSAPEVTCTLHANASPGSAFPLLPLSKHFFLSPYLFNHVSHTNHLLLHSSLIRLSLLNHAFSFKCRESEAFYPLSFTKVSAYFFRTDVYSFLNFLILHLKNK